MTLQEENRKRKDLKKVEERAVQGGKIFINLLRQVSKCNKLF